MACTPTCWRWARPSISLLLLSVMWWQPAGSAGTTPSKKCKKGVRATTECFFAANSDILGQYVDVFVDEGFEM